VARDVRVRRDIEAARAESRQSIKMLLLIQAGVLVLLALVPSFAAPYSSPTGQLVIAVLLASTLPKAPQREMINAQRWFSSASSVDSFCLRLPRGPCPTTTARTHGSARSEVITTIRGHLNMCGRTRPMNTDSVEQRWYTTEQLATLLGVDPSSLRRWRTSRPPEGPAFVRVSPRHII
jgi:hypothetical protein